MLRTLTIVLLALTLTLGLAGLVFAQPGGVNGQGRTNLMPAYYDGRLFLINFQPLDSTAARVQLLHNQSINTIYQSTVLLNGQPFVSVLDAIQGDGFNPLWQKVEITFIGGVTPFQITSDTEVDSLKTAGTISTTPTNELIRCAVLGPGPKNFGGTGHVGSSHSVRPAARTPSATTWGALKSLYR